MPRTVDVALTLEMDPKSFEKVRGEFLNDLADLLGVGPHEIKIRDIHHGCTNLPLEIPEDAQKLFDLIKMDHPDLPKQKVKEAANFRRKWHVNEFQQRPSDLNKKALVAPQNGNTLTWLHISDAHFEAPDSGAKRDFWSQDKVRKTLIQQLPRLLTAEDLIPDFVFFTGDVAFGGQSSEYELAIDFLGNLVDALPRGKGARVVLVPGNHDVNRDVVKRYQREESSASGLLTAHKPIIEFLKSPRHKDDRVRVLSRLDAFVKFARKCERFGQPPFNHGYFFTHVFECRALRVGIAGLNSAWRCSSDADRGKLILGLPQIDVAIEATERTDVAIALVHHPPGSDWYIDDEMIYQRETLFDGFDFLLHGHEHDPSERFIQSQGTVSAGALYTRERRPQSVNVVHVDLDSKQGWIFFWRLSEPRFRWVMDVDLCDSGYDLFPISGRRTKNRK